MKKHFQPIFAITMALILAACTSARVPATSTLLHNPTFTALPSPTTVKTAPTPTSTFSSTQLFELFNGVELNSRAIAQTDESLEGLVWPGGIEDFEDEPYVSFQQGFQFQYPKDWLVLENPDLAVISPDKMHTLCPQALGLESDQCGTPVVLTVITNPDIVQYFREIPFDKPGDPQEYLTSEDADGIVGLMAALGPFTPDQDFESGSAPFFWFHRIEINDYPALGMGIYGDYQPAGEPAGIKNPVIEYFLAVRQEDRVAVLFSMAPAGFWEQYQEYFVTTMQSFRFNSGPLPPTPTSTLTPTLIPAPPGQTPAADRFTFDGMNLQIPDSVLAADCYKAYQSTYPDDTMGFPTFDQPAGTYCLLIVISTIPSEEPAADILNTHDQFMRLSTAGIVDQSQNTYPLITEGTTSRDGITLMNLYAFTDYSAASFKLILPDGQEIPLSISSQPPPRLPTVLPVPTFTPLPNPELYYSSTPQPAARKFVDERGVEMVFIPAGEVQMGRSEEQSKDACQQVKGGFCGTFHYMAPEHTVSFDAFYIDVLEVSNARYAECVAAGVCVPPGSNASATRSNYYGNPEYQDYPVIFVDWQMARTFCQWRNADLPTEAQWEKAARGNDNRWFTWGDELDGEHANFNDVNSSTDGGRKDLDDGYADTALVDSFPQGASPYGVLNLAGNVLEWILDKYSAVFYEESPADNPIGSRGRLRVVRGGSWSAYEVYTLWVSFRDGHHPQSWDQNTGFRCARSP